jgi:hypothetical protein
VDADDHSVGFAESSMARTRDLLLRSYAAETARLDNEKNRDRVLQQEEEQRKNSEKMKKFA